jgi:hypothetical protein
VSDEKEKAETPAPEPECLACAARRTLSGGPEGFAWVVGFASGVRVARTGAVVHFCEEHMTDVKTFLEAMAAAESGEGAAPS